MAINMLTILLLTVLFTYTKGSFLGCPLGCRCDDQTFVVECERSKLDIIPITLNPAIQRLVLRNNNIKVVDAAFQFYNDLQYVDLSSNQLVDIPTRSFLHQEKLQELHLEKNKLSLVNNKTFQGLKSLTVLNLRENFLVELTQGVFSLMPKLEELNLGQNRIAKIDNFAFEGLLNLRVLYLDDNLLTSVPTESFSIILNLAELHVNLNALTSLQDDAFRSLNKLAVLDVGSADIGNISSEALRGLGSLRTLNMADNRLKQIPTTAMRNLERLEALVIGQNDFVNIKINAFKGLKNLKSIDITGCRHLEIIDSEAFSDNVNLEVVTLMRNKKLQKLSNGAFKGLHNLKDLILRENSLKNIPESVASWNKLRQLDLLDNPIHCDCQVVWLLKLAIQKNLTNIECSSPKHFQRQVLKSLNIEDLGCSFTSSGHQVIIVTICVSAAIILVAFGLFLFRYRLKVRVALKDYNFEKNTAEHVYEKNLYEDMYQVPVPVTNLYQELGQPNRRVPYVENECRYPPMELPRIPEDSFTVPVASEFNYYSNIEPCRVHTLRSTINSEYGARNDCYRHCPKDLFLQ